MSTQDRIVHLVPFVSNVMFNQGLKQNLSVPEKERKTATFDTQAPFHKAQMLHGQAALHESAQTLTGCDIYCFLSHIISASHKVLIDAFGDVAFNPLRKAWNFNEYHGLGSSPATERMRPGGGRAVQVQKSCPCEFPPPLLSLIFRIYHGRVVAMPGTRNAVTPTTALQTLGTWPVLWWSSGSKHWMSVWFEGALQESISDSQQKRQTKSNQNYFHKPQLVHWKL